MFNSFFLGGFECSTHLLRPARRLDVVAASRHDEFAILDYRRLHAHGIRAARDGVRWHLIEKADGSLDFGSVLPMLRAAWSTNTQVIWDLFHYGYPPHLDIFKPEFIHHFARFARAFIRFHQNETDAVPFITPVNEISFYSWIAGRVGHFAPFARRRANELKRQLVRACIGAVEAIWAEDRRARICHTEPVINVVAHPQRPQHRRAAEKYRLSQFEAWDMIAGRLEPELGGDPKYLDIIGANYYPHNQWMLHGRRIGLHHPLYKPFRHILQETYEHYRRPLFVAETGIEADARPGWLRYIASEVRAAQRNGVPIQGICLYPIINHPGWDDDRHCHNGLWDYPDANGERVIYEPLAAELARQQELFARFTSHPPAADTSEAAIQFQP